MTDLIVKTRDQVVADYLRDYKLRCPEANTDVGSQPYLDAILLADSLMPLYGNSIKSARAQDDEQKTLTELQAEAERLHVPLAGAVGSTGYVQMLTASGGTVLALGQELVEPSTRAVFRALTPGLYLNGSQCPIASVATGPAANLPAGTMLQWSSPPAGCGLTCTVLVDSNGNGLTGGRDAEGREQILEAIRDARANPPGSGNAAEYRRWAKSTPGVQIEEVFIYPCAYGPGTTGWTFTVPPGATGSREPTALQVSLVREHVASLAPRTDLGFVLGLVPQYVEIGIELTWAQGAVGWADEAPWPSYFERLAAVGSGALVVSGSTSPLAIEVDADNADRSTCGAPVPGQTWAFWDINNGGFVRKKVLTVAGAGPWTITFDGTFGASDTVYQPMVIQRVMPWSDSLAVITQLVDAYFKTIGPGEVKAQTYLDGVRARRDPPLPKLWPNRITKALETSLEALAQVDALDIVEGGTTVANVGLPPRLLRLSGVAVFPA